VHLEWSQIETTVGNVKPRYKELVTRFGKLKPYPVFSSPHGQAPMDAGPAGVLKEFPGMVVDSQAKADCQELLREISHHEKDQAPDRVVAPLRRQLLERLPELRFDGEATIELRFGALRYELLRALKQAPEVDQELTSQSDASIRVVLTRLHTNGAPPGPAPVG
jgi:hypothetical protein